MFSEQMKKQEPVINGRRAPADVNWLMFDPSRVAGNQGQKVDFSS